MECTPDDEGNAQRRNFGGDCEENILNRVFLKSYWETKIKPKIGSILHWTLTVGLGLALGHYYFYSNKESAELSLIFNTPPKLNLTYAFQKEDSSYFRLKYYGPSDLEDFWIEEKVYLIMDTSVFECRDAPRFQYLYFKGNMRSMGKLAPMEERKIPLPECWNEFMGILASKFKGNLISRFSVRGSSPNSPEFREDHYFLIDVGHRYYHPLSEVSAGEEFKQRIIRYNLFGPRSEIKWIPFINSFWPNPPKYWHYDENKILRPWYGSGWPPGKGRDGAFIFFDKNPFTIRVQPGVTAKLFWECKDGFSPGVTISGKPEEF